MRLFIALRAILVSGGIAIALYLPQFFSLRAWVGGLTLFVFAASAASRTNENRTSMPRSHRDSETAFDGISGQSTQETGASFRPTVATPSLKTRRA